MAEEKKQNEQPDKSAPKNDGEKKSSMMIWIVMLLVMIISAGAGIGIGQLFGGTSPTEETQPQETEKVDPLEEIAVKETDGKSDKTALKSWYFELEPVMANLNEPGATRYVMTTLIIEVNPNVDKEKGAKFLKEKSYPIKDWLTIYFAGLALEDIQGDKNLKEIQNYICEMLNEKLFPNAKPQIQHILFKEFAIQ